MNEGPVAMAGAPDHVAIWIVIAFALCASLPVVALVLQAVVRRARRR